VRSFLVRVDTDGSQRAEEYLGGARVAVSARDGWGWRNGMVDAVAAMRLIHSRRLWLVVVVGSNFSSPLLVIDRR